MSEWNGSGRATGYTPARRAVRMAAETDNRPQWQIDEEERIRVQMMSQDTEAEMDGDPSRDSERIKNE